VNKIRKADTVLVIKGKDKGRTGEVRRVTPPGKKTDEFGKLDQGKLIVTGVNIVKRHMKPRSTQRPGGIVEREAPISWTNVALVCPLCQKPTRVGFRSGPGGGKARYCKRCNENLD
jgi:large subunit ribosomal protein L24